MQLGGGSCPAGRHEGWREGCCYRLAGQLSLGLHRSTVLWLPAERPGADWPPVGGGQGCSGSRREGARGRQSGGQQL